MLTDKTKVADKSCSNNSERILQRDLVEKFLNEYFDINISYTISDDGIVDVKGSIELNYKHFNQVGLTELPIQFGHIEGSFVFDNSNIKTMKGFPHTINKFCSIIISKQLNSLEFSPKCQYFYCNDCTGLESLNGLNCEEFYGHDLNLKKIGTNFYAKEFKFNNFPIPTADEMRHFIKLNPEFKTNQKAPWITLINDFFNHKNMFRAICEFEALYNEPFLKQDEIIDINSSNTDMLF